MIKVNFSEIKQGSRYIFEYNNRNKQNVIGNFESIHDRFIILSHSCTSKEKGKVDWCFGKKSYDIENMKRYIQVK